MCGGIAGVTDREISNCLFNGKITTEDSPNAICYMDENINCYYNENCGGLSSRAIGYTCKSRGIITSIAFKITIDYR